MNGASTSQTRSLPRLGGAVAAFLVSAAFLVWFGQSRPAEATSTGTAISNAGVPVAISPQALNALQSAEAKSGLRLGPPTRLAVRNGRALYRINGVNGRCFAAGKSEAANAPSFGVLLCSQSDTAARQQLVDLSIYDLTRGGEGIRIHRLEGVAADGVASVGILGDAGAIIARVPVTRNIYSSPTLGDVAATGVVALNSHGGVLERLSYQR
jgi:hypothetical protein